MAYVMREFDYNCATDFEFHEDDCSIMRFPSPTPKEIYQNSKIKEIYLKQFNFPFCVDSSKFKILMKISQGTFG